MSAAKSISIIGCGWLGLPLGQYLADSGYRVKGSTTRKEKLPEIEQSGIEPYLLSFEPDLVGNPGDFSSSDILIINLPPRNQGDDPNYHRKQLLAIQQLAEKQIGKLLFVSSTGVYPNTNSKVMESDADPGQLSRGGVSLLEMENLFMENPDFQTTVIRFGGLYGPGRHPGRFLVGRNGLSGANNPVNMIHLEDCIGVIKSIIEQDIWGEIFNACSPTEETRKSFYHKAAKDLGIDPPEFSDETAPFKKVSPEKLINATGYQFKY
ncbi:MAG: SDR family oxidoreductase [Cyclobacteriaceae bacterium]|nr:SDR family oxidoreductase [Cyclobacteriaceae bacterium SS2]